jgi:hypothetical protein
MIVKSPHMLTRLAFALLAVLLGGCATNQAYSDATNVQERKIYIACAVMHAFLDTDQDADPADVVRSAMNQCYRERHAVMLKLIEENADKPFGMKFVESHMNELHAAMLDHIALRLTQSRARVQRGRDTGV